MTASGRDAALDLLRAVSLARVVVWHAIGAVWMTAFAAIPLMFFVAGSLLAGSLEPGTYRSVLLRRSRRLLVPLWVYGAVVAVVGASQASLDGAALELERAGVVRALTWLVPVVDPVDSHWHAGWLSTHLWYLRAYLWVLLLAPVVAAMARRAALAVPILGLVVVQLEVARHVGLPFLSAGAARVLIGDLVVYGLFALLGMAYRQRQGHLHRGLLAAGAGVLGLAAAGYVHHFGLPPGGVNASYPALLLTGLAWLLAAGAAEGPIRRVASLPRVARTTGLVSRRAVTVYLWHPAAIVLAYAVVEDLAVPTAPVVLALTVVLTAGAVGAVGFVEDLAAGRRRRHRFRLPVLRSALAVPAAVAALLVTIPVVAEPIVFPTAAEAEASSQARSPRLPPSYRAALGDSAFAAAPDDEPLIRLRNGRMPARQLQRALDRWQALHPSVQRVAVSLHVDGRSWTGSSHAPGMPPLDGGDRYHVASLTKPFTAALVLQAADRQLLGLDAPVPAIPGVGAPPKGTAITPRQLLQHTSGLVNYPATPQYRNDRLVTAEQAVAWALRTPLEMEPGTAVSYSNTNYLYLGLLLELVTGRPYRDLLRELVEPLGLGGIALDDGAHPGWVGHASGGVHATLEELVTFTRLLVGPSPLLSPQQRQALTDLGEHNVGAGAWPLCPCWTDGTGVKRARGLGHHVGHGGLYHEPATGLTYAMRIESEGHTPAEHLASLRDTLVAALRS